MKLIILVSAILLSTLGFSQEKGNKTIFKQLNTGESYTISISTTNYTANKIGELKDQLIGMYDEKVFDVDYNETNQLFSFAYNEYMQKEDLVSLFDKYSIDYSTSTRKNNLINQ